VPHSAVGIAVLASATFGNDPGLRNVEPAPGSPGGAGRMEMRWRYAPGCVRLSRAKIIPKLASGPASVLISPAHRKSIGGTSVYFRGPGRIMRAAIYARVSTKDQSCDMQLRDLRTYCTARGLEVAREYVDIGQSGAKDSRPELNALMADARKRKIDLIIVWRFDRFARSTKHLLLSLEEFRSLGVQFISYNENIDTSSPLGQALFTIISAVAQLERDLIRERVTAGIRAARASAVSHKSPPDPLTEGGGPKHPANCRKAGGGIQHSSQPLEQGELKTLKIH